MSYDLAIVGGGFAGLAAARAASLRGLKTIVLENKPALGVRLHTTGIFVREAADAYDIPHALTRRVTKVRLYGPKRRPVDLEGPGYYFLTTDTEAVLKWLGAEAQRAGAEIRTACRFDDAYFDGAWTLKTNGEPIRARFLIGADGARSDVAQKLGLSRNTRFLAGVEREYRDAGGLDPEFLHCFLDSALAPGYIAWAAPSPVGAQIGLAVAHGRKPNIDRFLAEAERRFTLDPAQALERRAGLIPCGGVVARWARPGALLVGDAAGMVSPLTGGGIHPALALGRRAGQAVADHLAAAGPPPEEAVRRDLPDWRAKLALRWTMDVAPPNWMIDAALSTAPMAGLAKRIFFHAAARREKAKQAAAIKAT